MGDEMNLDNLTEVTDCNGRKWPVVEVRNMKHAPWKRRVMVADLPCGVVCVAEIFTTRFLEGETPDLAWFGPYLHMRQIQPKPEPKYRPYETMEEAKALLGKVFVKRVDGSLRLFTGARDAAGHLVLVHGCVAFHPSDLLDKYTFEDGTPCGVLVEADQ